MSQSISTISRDAPWIQRHWMTIGSVILGSLFLALMARVSLPLPFTPVPLSMQTFAIFLLAGLLGSRNAMMSVMAYVAEGSCGLPVFAGGVSNPFWYVGPKAGYIVGFVAAAYLVGKLIELARNKSFFSIVLAISAGEVLILALGTLWLSVFVGPENAFMMGVAPFLIGAVLKIAAASSFLKGYYLVKK